MHKNGKIYQIRKKYDKIHQSLIFYDFLHSEEFDLAPEACKTKLNPSRVLGGKSEAPTCILSVYVADIANRCLHNSLGLHFTVRGLDTSGSQKELGKSNTCHERECLDLNTQRGSLALQFSSVQSLSPVQLFLTP